MGLAKKLSCNSPKIIMYHRFSSDPCIGKVDKASFENQIKYLKNKFNVISLNELCAHISNNEKLPKNSVIITVDDGYEDFYLYAYPILKKYKVPATIYVTYDFLDGIIWLCPDIIKYAVKKTHKENILVMCIGGEKEFNVIGSSNKHKAWNDIADYCLSISNKEKIKYITELLQYLDVKIPSKHIDEYAAFNWNQLKEMMDNDIEAGAHTFTHPRLTKLNAEELNREIFVCKKMLEKKLGRKVDTFAYPNGTRDDYNQDVKSTVIGAGYMNATVGFSDARTIKDVFELRRYSVGSDMFHFKKVVCGIEYLSHVIKQNGN